MASSPLNHADLNVMPPFIDVVLGIPFGSRQCSQVQQRSTPEAFIAHVTPLYKCGARTQDPQIQLRSREKPSPGKHRARGTLDIQTSSEQQRLHLTERFSEGTPR